MILIYILTYAYHFRNYTNRFLKLDMVAVCVIIFFIVFYIWFFHFLTKHSSEEGRDH